MDQPTNLISFLKKQKKQSGFSRIKIVIKQNFWDDKVIFIVFI